MWPLLILRPQPGADATAARARARGLPPLVHPLFAVHPLPWTMPQDRVDAVMFTSANAVRTIGSALERLIHLPAWCVGGATAQAARSAGFDVHHIGRGDGAELMRMMGKQGLKTVFHPCGADHMPLPCGPVRRIGRVVYESRRIPEPGPWPPHAVVLLHSARAALAWQTLIACANRPAYALAALSPAVAASAGAGWAACVCADHPDDAALLACAEPLCKREEPSWRDMI